MQLKRTYPSELEQAGHRAGGLSVFDFLYRLAYVARRRAAERAE